MTSDVEHGLLYLLAICMSSLETCLLNSPYFIGGGVVFVGVGL